MAKIETVGQLMDWLEGQPRDRKVLLSQDSEGNGFGFLYEGDLGSVEKDAKYRPDSIYMTREEWLQLGDARHDYEEPPEDGTIVTTLWPA